MADEEKDKARKVGLSDAEQARRMRQCEMKGFLQLAALLHDDVKAVKAMREESAFIAAYPNLPRGDEFAARVRGWLIAERLEWTQENLQKAVDAVNVNVQTYSPL
jgi:hypothetical protein